MTETRASDVQNYLRAERTAPPICLAPGRNPKLDTFAKATKALGLRLTATAAERRLERVSMRNA